MKRFVFLVIFLSFLPLAAHGTCSQEDAPYELKQSDPAYEQAMKLKTNLSARASKSYVFFRQRSSICSKVSWERRSIEHRSA
jgi:hypothetical protein